MSIRLLRAITPPSPSHPPPPHLLSFRPPPHPTPPLAPNNNNTNSVPSIRLPAHAPPLNAPHRPPRPLPAPETARDGAGLGLRAQRPTKCLVGDQAVRGRGAGLRVRGRAPQRPRPRDVRPVRIRLEGESDRDGDGKERGRRERRRRRLRPRRAAAGAPRRGEAARLPLRRERQPPRLYVGGLGARHARGRGVRRGRRREGKGGRPGLRGLPPADGGGSGGGDERGRALPRRPHSPILYANDLDVSSRTGVVFFTDSAAIAPLRGRGGFWDTMQAYVLSLAQGEPTGRLLSYDPRTGETRVVAGGLWFANGVALAPCETWAAVVETNSLRVHKVYVEGPKKGQKEVLLDGLPGYPDGLSRAFRPASDPGSREKEQDGFWLALVAPLQPAARHLAPWRLGRLLMAWTPEGARPPLRPWGAAARLGLRGAGGGGAGGQGVEVEGWLLDPNGEALSSTSAVTDAREHGSGDRLFFGNLAGGYVSFVDGASRKVEEAKRLRLRSSGVDRSEL